MVNNFSRRFPRSDGAQSEQEPSSRRGGAGLQGLGAALRERREAMGVSLAEVEVATRIRQKYLSALEADDWHLLPGEVVGRGFLRNYAEYLGLEPNDVIDQRRAVADNTLAVALSSTSAGSALPPVRDVDYRPKEVDLKDEVDGIQRGEIRLTPILAIVALAVLVGMGWWGITTLGSPLAGRVDEVQTRVAQVFERTEPTPTSALLGIINAENLATGEAQTEGAVPATVPAAGSPSDDSAAPDAPASAAGGGAALSAGGSGQAPAPTTPAGDQTGVVLLPTATPTESVAAAPQPTPEPPTVTPTIPPPPPTDTPVPLPTDTPIPEVPTDTPTPEPPAVVAPACADARSVITSPGMNQVLSGVVGVTGSASHENLQYYKLEYAPGANVAGGFVYFAGASSPIQGGLLGNLDTRSLPNGEYTLRITVVDQTGNFPPPCTVSVVIQN